MLVLGSASSQTGKNGRKVAMPLAPDPLDRLATMLFEAMSITTMLFVTSNGFVAYAYTPSGSIANPQPLPNLLSDIEDTTVWSVVSITLTALLNLSITKTNFPSGVKSSPWGFENPPMSAIIEFVSTSITTTPEYVR